MLQSLHIENIAVIEKADIAFGTGFTVLTGETGAGKSIVIDALNAVLGERIRRDLVRNGAERAYISAVFAEISTAAVRKLEELGFALDEDGLLVIQRSLTADGKAGCRINGRPSSVSALREIGRILVNIHGQHENQTLLQPERHVEYLDRLGGLQTVRTTYEKSYHEYCRIRRTIRSAAMDENEKNRRVDALRYQIQEIDGAALTEGELKELESRRELARHSEKIAESLRLAKCALLGEEDTIGALEQTSDAAEALRSVGTVAESLDKLAQRLQTSLYDLQECANEVRDMAEEMDFDEQDLASIEDRLAVIQRVIRKYGTDEKDALQKREQLQAELDSIEGSEAYLEQLQQQSDAAREDTIAAAQKLTASRKEAAKRFEKNVCEQLAFLDMPGVRLEVSMEPVALTVAGGDKVEFCISANPGEPARPIARIASGGELSRVMLALKAVLAEADEIDTLVFDEIDTGISGRAATKVGIKLREIADCRQILCVTHLAQIAAQGHEHIMVSKSVESGRTFTAVTGLDEDGRRRELARIIGGEVTPSTLQAAGEMRQKAGT